MSYTVIVYIFTHVRTTVHGIDFVQDTMYTSLVVLVLPSSSINDPPNRIALLLLLGSVLIEKPADGGKSLPAWIGTIHL